MSLSPKRCDVKTRERRERPGKQLRRVLGTSAAKKAKTLGRDRLSPTRCPESQSGSMLRKSWKTPRRPKQKNDDTLVEMSRGSHCYASLSGKTHANGRRLFACERIQVFNLAGYVCGFAMDYEVTPHASSCCLRVQRLVYSTWAASLLRNRESISTGPRPKVEKRGQRSSGVLIPSIYPKDMKQTGSLIFRARFVCTL